MYARIVKHDNHVGRRTTLAFSFGTSGLIHQSSKEEIFMDLWQYELRKHTPEDWDTCYESVRRLWRLPISLLFLKLLEFIGKALLWIHGRRIR